MMMHDFQEESMETDMGKEIQGNHSGEAQGEPYRGDLRSPIELSLSSRGAWTARWQ